ncbi:MAG TPA: CHASE3 domain-containing protein [Methylophilaceae bacterium]|nr:CHASE3 domain-containing protein [Methylophilaceae bacterium]
MRKAGYFYNRKLELRLIVVFVLISLILLFLGWQALTNNQAAVTAQSRVIHINEQLRILNRYLIALFETETGQRGYLLTENLAYLEPYALGRREIEDISQRLKSLLGEEVEPEFYQKLDSLKADKLLELEATIALVKEGRRTEALSLVQSDHGKQKMDQIRAQITPILESKRAEVAELSRLAAERAHHARWSLYSLISAVLLFIVFAYALVIRELSEKKRLKQRIEQSGNTDVLTQLMSRGSFLEMVRWRSSMRNARKSVRQCYG